MQILHKFLECKESSSDQNGVHYTILSLEPMYK